jgi:hypothetical protein
LKTEILDVTFGEKPKKWGETEKTQKKIRYFTKIEPYLNEFVANESSFGRLNGPLILPYEQNFDLDKSRQNHGLKEHHKISNISTFRCEIL